MRIALVCDAVAPDAPADARDTLVQRDAIRAALERVPGRTIRDFPVTLQLEDLRKSLTDFAPDVAFNLSEAPGGRDRLIAFVPTLLETLGIPFTGAPANALFLAADKSRAKRWFARSSLLTPFSCDAEDIRAEGHLFAHGLSRERLIVKSRWDHASLGLDADAVVNKADLPPNEMDMGAWVLARLKAFRRRHESPGLVENFVEGREFNVGVIEGRRGAAEVLPPAEIRFVDFGDRPTIVDYAAKWAEDSEEYQKTVRSFDFPAEDEVLLKKLRGLARQAWYCCGLRGYARMDYRVDRRGLAWLLEVNPNPCLSPDAGFAAAAGQAGYSYEAVVERLLERALAESDPGHGIDEDAVDGIK